MRKIGFARYKQKTKEILPKTYKVNEITCRRKMFCMMINQYLSSKSQLSLKNENLFKNNLLFIFEAKIMSFFQFYNFKPEKPRPVSKIYAQESLLINQFFKQSKNKKMRYLSKNINFNQNFTMLLGYSHPATDLIQLIFNGKDIEMMLDLNEIFTRTIYNRIKKEENKLVALQSPYINITQNNITTRLLPRWKQVDSKNINRRANHINDGFKQLKDENIDALYLVYPKTDNFKRHISIQNHSQEQIKMVPYSFTFINRKGKAC